MFVSSPLEQFEIVPLFTIWNGDAFSLAFTNSSFAGLVAIGTGIAIFGLASKNQTLIPNRWQSLAESTYEFVFGMLQETVGEKGYRYFPLIFVLFLFILFCNILGMIPYSFTITSHIVVTFALSLAFFTGINVVAFRTHGLHFFSLFLPAGAPLVMAPFLVPIELLSYFIRVLSLAIRLFANMMAGHCLLKILAGFGWTMLTMGGLMSIASLAPFIVVFAITGLEIAIALLQAYVFAILICLYLKDAIHLH
jgi:ATP synthase subunit 6